MQIVIDIPNTIYQRYLKNDWDLGDADVIRNCIKKGIPLPKIIINGNICDSCTNKGCIFQYGIVRSHCDFYKAGSEVKDADSN